MIPQRSSLTNNCVHDEIFGQLSDPDLFCVTEPELNLISAEAGQRGQYLTVLTHFWFSLLQGSLNTYRFCDNVWTFVLNDVEFREVTDMVKVDKVKIVACDGKSESTQN